MSDVTQTIEGPSQGGLLLPDAAPHTPRPTHPPQSFVLRYGPIEVDIPRSVGYFGGLWAAVALEIIDPPLALFIAAVPFVKMLSARRFPMPIRFAGHVVEGAAKPVGSDADGVVRVPDDDDT